MALYINPLPNNLESFIHPNDVNSLEDVVLHLEH